MKRLVIGGGEMRLIDGKEDEEVESKETETEDFWSDSD